MTSKLKRTEQIVILVLTCLIIMGSGFRLWYSPDELVVEVDPVLWAEEYGEKGHKAEKPDGEVSGPFRGEQDLQGESGMPRNGEAAPGQEMQTPWADAAAEPVNNRVNINTASAEELQSLPGIGPVLAGRIIEYRRQYGPFIDVEQLVEVKGIGPKVLERLRPLVTAAGGG